VAFIGWSFYSYWARLAGVRIIAEVPHGESWRFWEADREGRDRTLETLFATGVTAVVTEVPWDQPAPEGWVRLGETAYYALPSARRPR